MSEREEFLAEFESALERSDEAFEKHGMSLISDQEIDAWLLMMERLFGKDFLQGDGP